MKHEKNMEMNWLNALMKYEYGWQKNEFSPASLKIKYDSSFLVQLTRKNVDYTLTASSCLLALTTAINNF